MQRIEKWVITSRPGDYVEIGKRFNISPVIARILRNRGIESDSDIRDFLETDPERLRSPEYSGSVLKDMDKAVDIILGRIKEGKKIRIVGDYDIDGVTSVYILEKGLREAGANIDHRIPHRIRDGYGLNEGIIREAFDAGIDTILTCDNGISARAEISLAKELGMTVVITDHHEVPFHVANAHTDVSGKTLSGDAFTGENGNRVDDLPSADAVVDPKRQDCPYPFKEICGANVAYKFIQCLYEKAGLGKERTEKFLEIASFATIGDVMPLVGENRILVKEGLKRLGNTENAGIRALSDLNNLNGKELTPYHVGFILGPCLNAAGRLDDAEEALSLLLCEDPDEAHEKAVVLKEMNDSRKALTDKGVEKALSMAASPEYENDRILVIYLPECHESIAGIIAGRVREATGHPVFILTDGQTPEGEHCLKGSGRSSESYHMFEEMQKVSDIFLRFGGHAMAAGLSLPSEKLPELRRRLNENTTLTGDDLAVKISIDMEMPLSFVNMGLIEELKELEPFGTGNKKPCFALRNAVISDMRIFGANNNVLKGKISDGSGYFDCVYFGADAADKKSYIERCHEGVKIIYSPEINEFRGTKSMQINIMGIK